MPLFSGKKGVACVGDTGSIWWDSGWGGVRGEVGSDMRGGGRPHKGSHLSRRRLFPVPLSCSKLYRKRVPGSASLTVPMKLCGFKNPYAESSDELRRFFTVILANLFNCLQTTATRYLQNRRRLSLPTKISPPLGQLTHL